MALKEEVECALRFLRELLTKNNYGSIESELDRYLDVFRADLLSYLEGHVHPDPMVGSAYRCLRNHEGQLDPLFEQAALTSGAECVLDYLPATMCLWIDPGCVSYRIGYTADIQEIFLKQAPNSPQPVSSKAVTSDFRQQQVSSKMPDSIATARAAAAAAAAAALAACQFQNQHRQAMARRRMRKPMRVGGPYSWMAPGHMPPNPIAVGGVNYMGASPSLYH